MTHRLDIDRLADALARVSVIQVRATARAASPPRIHETEWRGPAFAAYEAEMAGLASNLLVAREDLAAAKLAILRAVADAGPT
ncbi:hypothetical protein [Salinibacterium sp. ZJ77]|uniref:hypothetical protein n=1 Tax=Salinibacterium sp. ZJ77 TaxID=2708337 RepID=UPI00141FB58A|nr:hypothetical protein [Salinibacterium sp. ZJ77]